VAWVLGEIEAVERLRRAGHAGERRGTRPLFASPRDDARPALGSRLRRGVTQAFEHPMEHLGVAP